MTENTARYRRQWTPSPTHDNDSLTKIYNLIPERSSVLDVGCSVGQLGTALKNLKGCTVTGIDIEPDAVSEAKKVLDHAVVGNVLGTPLEKIVDGKRFEFVIFADVLEHLNEPVQVLKDAQKVLTENGAILISIPNVSHASVRLSLLEGRFDYTKEGLLDRTHVLFYTKKSLIALIAEAGLTLVELDRTRLLAKESDIPVKEEGFITTDLIKTVERMEEATTYQFIAKVVPATHPLLKSDVAPHVEKLERQLKDTRAELTVVKSILGGNPSAIASQTAESLVSRVEAMEAHLASQKGDLLRRLQGYELRIQALEKKLEAKVDALAAALGTTGLTPDGTSNRSGSTLQERITACEAHGSRIWNLLPIRLWRRIRGLD